MIKGNTMCMLPGLIGVACSSILSVSLEGLGCEPVFNLAVTPEEAVNNMYLLWQNYTFNLWEKLMYVIYTADQPGSSVGHPTGALALICRWVLWHGWLTLMGCSVRMTSYLESSTCLICMLIPIFRIGQFNSCMLQSITDHYIIKCHGSHAWYGCWTIKALVEAKVLHDCCIMSHWGIAALLIITRLYGVSMLLTSIRPA